MSLTTKQIDELRAYAKDRKGELAKLINDAADTIEMLSAKLHASQMERISQYYHGGWIPCQERLPEEDGEYLVLYYIRSRYKPYIYDVMSFANDLYKIDKYDFPDKKGQKGWFYCDPEYGLCEYNNVYAWMPLPEPYREEGENE